MINKSKAGRYERIITQLKPLLLKTDFLYAKMATINAILYHKMNNFFWVGFYIVVDDKLLVGPYQGPLACQELEENKGVCWASINTKKAVIVPDVEQFPDHIACDSRSKSEITIPVFDKHNLIAILDIDSNILDNFDETDEKYLTEIVGLLTN